jgi:LPXTG-motif cell wall-anchored protein
MPRTASPLPLIAMSGALTLLAGMWISRRRRSA